MSLRIAHRIQLHCNPLAERKQITLLYNSQSVRLFLYYFSNIIVNLLFRRDTI